MENSPSPVQFNFAEYWNSQILPRRKMRPISEGFHQLQKAYEEMAELKFERLQSALGDSAELSELAGQQLILDLHTARVKCFDLYWIQENFNSDQLAHLSLAVAVQFYPEIQWFVVGANSEVAVVTNADRTMVFDLKNFHRLTGAASLCLAGESKKEFQNLALDRCRRLSLVSSNGIEKVN